jgi:ferric enterobactin receptor
MMTGRIRDIKNAESFSLVNIVVKSSNQVSQTIVDGYFTIIKVPTDTLTLQYSIWVTSCRFYTSIQICM